MRKDWCTQCISVAALWRKRVVEDNQMRHAHFCFFFLRRTGGCTEATCTQNTYFILHWLLFSLGTYMNTRTCLFFSSTHAWIWVPNFKVKICAWALKWSPIPCVCLSLIPRLQLSKHLQFAYITITPAYDHIFKLHLIVQNRAQFLKCVHRGLHNITSWIPSNTAPVCATAQTPSVNISISNTILSR